MTIAVGNRGLNALICMIYHAVIGDSPQYEDFDSEEQILLKDLLQKQVEILPRSLLW